jgi:hypothetical protein
MLDGKTNDLRHLVTNISEADSDPLKNRVVIPKKKFVDLFGPARLSYVRGDEAIALKVGSWCRYLMMDFFNACILFVGYTFNP